MTVPPDSGDGTIAAGFLAGDVVRFTGSEPEGLYVVDATDVTGKPLSAHVSVMIVGPDGQIVCIHPRGNTSRKMAVSAQYLVLADPERTAAADADPVRNREVLVARVALYLQMLRDVNPGENDDLALAHHAVELVEIMEGKDA